MIFEYSICLSCLPYWRCYNVIYLQWCRAGSANSAIKIKDLEPCGMTLSTDMWGASNRINDQCRMSAIPSPLQYLWKWTSMRKTCIQRWTVKSKSFLDHVAHVAICTCQPMTMPTLIILCLWYLTFFMCLLPWQGHAYVHQGCDSPSESQHITMTVDTSAMVASRVHFMEVLAKLLSFVMFHAWLMGLTQMVDWWHVWHSNWNFNHLRDLWVFSRIIASSAIS